ncbi:hypothetical protein JCM11251_007949 [Rhodosporidiobolus azoricus]
MTAEGDQQPVKKTRSRLGCLTCRSRHKRCDETKLPEHEGSCRRCFRGSWECRWPPPPSERPLKRFVKKTNAGGGALSGGTTNKKGSSGAAAAGGDAAEATTADAGDNSSMELDSTLSNIAVDAPPPELALPHLPFPLPSASSGLGFSVPSFPPTPGASFNNLPPGATATGAYNPAFPSPNPFYANLGPPPPSFTTASPRSKSRRLSVHGLPSPSFGSATLAPPHAPTPTSSSALQHLQPVSISTPSSSAAALLNPVLNSASSSNPNPNPYADLDFLAPLPHLSLKPGEDLSAFFSSLDAELGTWDGGAGSIDGGSTGSPPGFFSAGLAGPSPAAGESQQHQQHQKQQPFPSFSVPTTRPTTATSETYSPSGSIPSISGASPKITSNGGELVTVARARNASLVGAVLDEVNASSAGAQGEGAGGEGGEGGERYLDPVYNTFNDGFFRSLPKPVRDVVCKNVYNVVVGSELSRNAGMAMVMLYRLRTQLHGDNSDSSDPASIAEQQAKLLAQSNQFFQRALEHIQTPIPFEAKMVAVLDMQNYQFDLFGAAAGNAIVLLGEFFVHEELGLQPILDLSNSSVLLSTFGWTDCVRCICIPGRRTIFTYLHLPGDPDPSNPSTLITDSSSPPSDIQVHFGLPVGLMLCIAATTNLAAEMDALPDEVVRVKAEAIEKAARGWKAPIPDAQELADGAAYLEKLSTAEMWRHAVIVFLYQSVHKHGSLSRILRAAMQQILTIGSGLLTRSPAPTSTPSNAHNSLPSSNSTSSASTGANGTYPPREQYLRTPADRAVPWFLAGTVASLPSDRALCKRGLEMCGELQGFKDNVQALERIWEVVDEKGWGVDWRGLLQAEKKFVGFL